MKTFACEVGSKLARFGLVMFMVATGCAATTPRTVRDCGLTEPLPIEVRSARTVIVGEVHGNEEMPKFVVGLACSLLNDGRSVRIGLEMAEDLTPDLRAYLDSDGGQAAVEGLTASSHWQREADRSDGRGSRAMFNLIEVVRVWHAAGAKIDMAGFDVPAMRLIRPEDVKRFMAQRDREMAQNADALVTAGTTLVLLTGNGHAATHPDEASFPAANRMGALMSHRPDLSILLVHRGGQSWGCDRDGCGRYDLDSPQYSDAALDGRIDLKRQKGYDGVAYVGVLTASPPMTKP